MTSGWVLLDKPAGMTSRYAGGCVARMFGAKTFGHIGTLDPFATGILPVALGEATKMVPFLDEIKNKSIGDKEYKFNVQWGFETDTLDITGTEIKRDNKVPSVGDISAVCGTCIGPQMQTPPIYSAVHVNGVRAYQLARRGLDVSKIEIKPRKIEIFDLKMTDSNSGFYVLCSTGTYVRSLARDIGQKAGGYLATVDMIRRMRTGDFSLENAISLEKLENLYNNGNDSHLGFLCPIDFGLDDILVQKLTMSDAALFRNGGFVAVGGEYCGYVRVYSDDRFIGIGNLESGMLRPKRVITE